MINAKVALVTAGSNGLGAAIARILAVQLGANVAINYFGNVARAEELVQKLQAESKLRHTNPPKICAIRADARQKEDIAFLVEETVAAFDGRLDVVISNVGWTQVRTFFDIEDNVNNEDWDRCYEANVKSHLWLFHAARKYLEESNRRDGGAAVFVSTASLAGVKPSGSSLAYAVSKAAQIHLMKSLATISAPSIRVNSVSPGIMLTDWGLTFPPETLSQAKRTNKLGCFATVEDVAEQVKVFVTSKTVTGQNAIIDAGYML